ncbi:MAG: Peptide deformylase [Thermoleophilia bacterium]|nr:Peptide deformylase [Thermoleophilia bacterium]
MPARPVVTYPDARLKTECDPLALPVDDATRELARDLLETMESFPGCVGIAAPQVGALVRMLAIDVTGHAKAKSCHGRRLLINPVVVERSAERVRMREGCLSIPDFTGNVTRAATLVVEALDLEGKPQRLACDAYEARVVLHELDHLDGLLFLDRVQHARDVFPRKKYQ